MPKLTTLRCGTCGKRYNNPATHVCRTRLDRKRKPGKTSVKPKLTFTCKTCGKTTSNPLSHTCRVTTDFRRRKATHTHRQKAASNRRRNAARRKAARKTATPAKPAAPKSTPVVPSFDGGSSQSGSSNHDYRQCFQKSAGTRWSAPEDCPRYPCRVYREGHDNGLEIGRQLGQSAGYSDGYTNGYADAARDHADNER